MPRVRLNTIYVPQCAAGETENHYGVPFTATAIDEKDAKGNPVLILTADLPDKEAAAMIAAERVTLMEAPAKEPAK